MVCHARMLMMIDKVAKVGKQCGSQAFRVIIELITLVCGISFINSYMLCINRYERGQKVITQHPLMTGLEWLTLGLRGH
jgi:hypothetical protein